jgi:hypothetical protein
MELADGSWILLAFLLIGFVGIVIGYYTVGGSGITPRAYGKNYSDAPGAREAGDASGHDPRVRLQDWSRGTR